MKKSFEKLKKQLSRDARWGIICLSIFILYYYWASMLTPRSIGIFDMVVYVLSVAFGIGFGITSIRRKDSLNKIIGFILIFIFVLLLFSWTKGWIRDFADTFWGMPRA
jgi:small-conductance mechanosensitive channel